MMLSVLDPAWKSDAGGGGKGANAQYALESGRALAGHVRQSGAFDMEGAALSWVWATTLSMCSGETHEFVGRLSLRPCASWVWVKTDPVVSGVLVGQHLGALVGNACEQAVAGRDIGDIVGAFVDTVDKHMRVPTLRRKPGIGQYQFCDHEFLILCRRGGEGVFEMPEARPRSVIFAPVGIHSEKPAEAWRVIEAVSESVLRNVIEPIDAVEFFCRKQRRGWGAWGTLDGPDAPVIFRPAKEEWPCR